MKTPKPLRFTPYAWAKLVAYRDAGDSEVGGFCVAGTEDPLLVTDLELIDQECTVTTVELDGPSILQYLERCSAANIDAEHCYRIWWHTHPEMSAKPSGQDEHTFSELFDRAPWGIMFILSKTDDHYARARFGRGPGGEVELRVCVDWSECFDGTDANDRVDWQLQYENSVTIVNFQSPVKPLDDYGSYRDRATHEDRDDWFRDSAIADFQEIYTCNKCQHQYQVKVDDRFNDGGDQCEACGSDDVKYEGDGFLYM